MTIGKIKILGSVFELPARQPIWPLFMVNGLNWQCFLAGSSKTAPRIFIFSIVLGAEYLSYVKSIATYAPTFFGYIISVLASVYRVPKMHVGHTWKLINGPQIFEKLYNKHPF